MRFAYPPYLALLALLALPAQALEFTGRLSLLGSVARPQPDQVGYQVSDNDHITANQQSIRLMFDETGERGEWSLHLKASRLRLRGTPHDERHSSDLFRVDPLEEVWSHQVDGVDTRHLGVELDRAYYRYRLDQGSLTIGRQPIDWGAGRFWQPLNIFGAFAPTDLDTDYKPGIDALVVERYPTPFSSLTAALVFPPLNDAEHEGSAALHYRRQVGELSELSLLAGSVDGNGVVGGAFESAWGGMGWRLEGRLQEGGAFWIAGLDYQFDDGTLLTAEWHHNGLGADTVDSLAGSTNAAQAHDGLRQHLGRRVLGIALNRDLTPLLNANYTLLAAPLKGRDGRNSALLHQLNLSYSLSDESDLLLSLSHTNGKGLDADGDPQSEFGHLPSGLTLRYRLYF